MSAAVVLNADPAGILSNPNSTHRVMKCRQWLVDWLVAGRRVLLPEVVDYEVRRELIRAIDTVKKRWQRARKHLDSVELLPDRRGPEERRTKEEREMIRDAAQEVLSPRQHRIVQMSLDGWSVHDIATQLNVSSERVSDEKYKGICKLREHFEVETANA